MMRIARYLPAVILLALVSCGDTAIFLEPVEEPAKVRIETILSGEVLLPASLVPVTIGRDPVFTGDPETADRLIVELRDTDGVVLSEVIYESVDQADDLPAFQLPEIGEGLFVLRTSYLDGDELIESTEVPFFIARGQFTVYGLSSFPATLYPGSSGLLSLNLDTPPGSDPYLEWLLDDDLVQSGPLSETGSTIEILAPDETGAYTVAVHLYPESPEYGDEPIPSFITHETELIVSRDAALDQSDLSPERNYYVLHHFLGDLRDNGARSEMFESVSMGARAIGDPSLAVESDIFGYRLDGDDGFELEGLTLPVREGQLTPFSLSFRLRPDSVEDRMGLLDIETSGRPILSLESDADGILTLDLGEGQAVVRSAETVISADTTSVITVSVLPVEDQTVVHFYVDGVTVLSEIVGWDFGDLLLSEPESTTDDGWMFMPGTTYIAGEEGFIGILDEFGVYFRDDSDRPSADTEIFHSAMLQIHGEKLIYAEGFESDEIPDTVEVEGPSEIDTGRLVLGEGAVAFFPLFGFSSEELVVTVSFDALPGSRLRFFAGEGAALILDTASSEFEVEGAVLEFRFAHSDGLLLVVSPDGEETEIILADDVEFTGIRLEVSQIGDDPAAIAVESVLAWREYPEIPASLLEPEDGEQPESDE